MCKHRQNESTAARTDRTKRLQNEHTWIRIQACAARHDIEEKINNKEKDYIFYLVLSQSQPSFAQLQCNMATLEELYKYYESLTDAKEKAGEVTQTSK